MNKYLMAAAFLVTLIAGSADVAAQTAPQCSAPVKTKAQTARSPLSTKAKRFTTKTSISAKNIKQAGAVCVIVAEYLEPYIDAELTQFVEDLSIAGYDTELITMGGGTVEDLKDLMKTKDAGGFILVGNLPRAWFLSTGWGHEEYPMDLFLMDQDGNWSDADNDGIYDGHSGDKGAEVWVSRIDAHAMEYGSEVAMLKHYFRKNHRFRIGEIQTNKRGLEFVDNDWGGGSSYGLNQVYSDVTTISSSSQTTAANYKAELEAGYEFVHLQAHSSPWGHTFLTSNGTVMLPEIANINPQTLFLNLFCCSNCRWTEPNCLGNWYIYASDTVLTISGSTKTGAIQDYSTYFGYVDARTNFGEAIRDWFSNSGINNEVWNYGVVLLGDGTLHPSMNKGLMKTGPTPSRIKNTTQPKQSNAQLVAETNNCDFFPVLSGEVGENKHLAWVTMDYERLDIAYSQWDGSSWSPHEYMEEIEVKAYWDVNPGVAPDPNGNATVAWADFTDDYDYLLYTATAPDFSAQLKVGGGGYHMDPQLVYTDKMWMVYQLWGRGEGDIYVASLDDSFPQTLLSGDVYDQITPAATQGPDGKVHIVWVSLEGDGEKVQWVTGDDTGFSTPETISTLDFAQSPQIGIAGDALVAAWQGYADSPVIRAAVWNGDAWDAPQTVWAEDDCYFATPAVGTTPNNEPAVIWQKRTGGDSVLMLSVYKGTSWNEPIVIAESDYPQWAPTVSGDLLVWAEPNGTNEWELYSLPVPENNNEGDDDDDDIDTDTEDTDDTDSDNDTGDDDDDDDDNDDNNDNDNDNNDDDDNDDDNNNNDNNDDDENNNNDPESDDNNPDAENTSDADTGCGCSNPGALNTQTLFNHLW